MSGILRKSYEKGLYSDVISYADFRLTKFKDDKNALWYKACALYQMGKVDEARELFLIVLKIEPEWASSVKAWLDVIDEPDVKTLLSD